MNLITGGLGYIGSHMALELPYSIVIDDTSTCDYKRRAMLEANGIKVFCMDIADAKVQELISHYKVDTIFHFAAKTSVMEGEANPDLYAHENVEKATVLAKMAQEAGVQKFIMASSAAVYGVPEAAAVTPDAPMNPVNVYGQTKLDLEDWLRGYAVARPMRLGFARFFNVIGADPHLRSGRVAGDVLGLMIQAIKQGTPFNIYGQGLATIDGTPARDFIYVGDVVERMDRLADKLDDRVCVIENFGTAKSTTVAQLGWMLEQVSGKKLDIRMRDTRPGEIAEIRTHRGPEGMQSTSVMQAVKTAWAYAQK